MSAWGCRTTAILLGLLLIANLANTVSEFAGVAASMEIFGVSKFISVPIAAVVVWLLIVKGNYKTVERVFLVASLIYLTYVISGVLRPSGLGRRAAGGCDTQLPLRCRLRDPVRDHHRHHDCPLDAVLPASVHRRQRAQAGRPAYERLDVIVGSFFAVLVAGFIVIACAATIHARGLTIETAKDAALALRPLAGSYASTLFALGLLNASIFSAAILPLSTAYVVCEAFGWESGVDRNLREAPIFFGIYTAMIVLGAAIILLPIRSLIQAMLASQTLNGVLLPVILVVMLMLINDRRIMGRFANGRVLNLITGTMVVVLILLTILLLALTAFPGLGAFLTPG